MLRAEYSAIFARLFTQKALGGKEATQFHAGSSAQTYRIRGERHLPLLRLRRRRDVQRMPTPLVYVALWAYPRQCWAISGGESVPPPAACVCVVV